MKVLPLVSIQYLKNEATYYVLYHYFNLFLNIMTKGHVDCTGTILSLDLEGDSLWVKIKLQEDILRYLVPKGFVSVDGTSLTVCEVSCSSACYVHL